MDQKSAEIKRIHEYISSLDKVQERKRRNKYFIGIPLVLVLLGLAAVFYFRPNLFQEKNAVVQSDSLLQFDELNLSDIRDHFEADGEALFVRVPEINEVVTLNSEKDYWQLLDEMALRFMDEESEARIDSLLVNNTELSSLPDTVNLNISTEEEVSETETDTENDTEDTALAAMVKDIRLLVNGNRYTGNPHTFTIKNYHPELSYSLDLGNGISREMTSPQIKYSYRRRGRFTAILKASYQGEEVFSTKAFLSIRNAPKKEAEKASEVILTKQENTPPTQPAQPVESVPAEVEVFEVSENRTSEESITPKSEKPETVSFMANEDTGTQVSETEIVRSSNEVASAPVSSKEKADFESITPLMVASQMPAFPGGKDQMLQYLNTRIKYPQPARDFHVEGIVYVQFVVQADGSLTDHKVLKGLGYGCDEEALRITKAMPSWTPGRQQGSEVPVLFTLPVNFQLIK
ncbi:MAG: TonB family protein [Bacteroidota bacterium]